MLSLNMNYSLMNETTTLFLSAITGLIVIYLVRFYIKVYRLPRGPFPLPIFGNILLFRGTKVNQFVTIANLEPKYGPVFTVWMGTTPMVFISDLELIKEAFNSRNNEFMGRPDIIIRDLITQGKGIDVMFTDYGPVWVSLRRVAHAGVRKLAASDKLAYMVRDSVDNTVALILKNEGTDKAFSPFNYIYLSVYNIIARSAFGKRYSLDDPEFIYIKNSFDYFRHNVNSLTLIDRLPIIKPFYYKTFNKVSQTLLSLSNTITRKYREHLTDNQKGVIRDFCDGLIEAKEEAIAEVKESAPHLSDNNLSFVIFNLFFAGSDTSNYMMRWIILLMANNLEMQTKLRDEIETVIGDRVALLEDRMKCHYVNAFISECLRFRPVAPISLSHAAMCDAKIGNYFVPKGCFVAPLIWTLHSSKQYWTKPEEFDPTRFLQSDGQFIKAKIPYYIPFSTGRRICLGEKLALADLFLITVRLLQKTADYMFVLPDGEGSADLEPDSNVLFLCTPNPFEVILRKK